jgi:RNase P subunit RPR2
MITHVLVTCHRCGHPWAYMESKVASVERREEGTAYELMVRLGKK